MTGYRQPFLVGWWISIGRWGMRRKEPHKIIISCEVILLTDEIRSLFTYYIFLPLSLFGKSPFIGKLFNFDKDPVTGNKVPLLNEGSFQSELHPT